MIEEEYGFDVLREGVVGENARLESRKVASEE